MYTYIFYELPRAVCRQLGYFKNALRVRQHGAEGHGFQPLVCMLATILSAGASPNM